MKKFFQIALGIIAAIGGFVDIGELVFNTQAGADFRYTLLWAVPVGVIGIVVFAEMTGRIATVSGRPIFDVVRMRMGLNVALVTLVASLLINLITLAAEVGGMAIVLQLLFDVNVSTLILLAEDYDGGQKAWVRWADGSDDIVPGSQVERSAAG